MPGMLDDGVGTGDNWDGETSWVPNSSAHAGLTICKPALLYLRIAFSSLLWMCEDRLSRFANPLSLKVPKQDEKPRSMLIA